MKPTHVAIKEIVSTFGERLFAPGTKITFDMISCLPGANWYTSPNGDRLLLLDSEVKKL